MRPVLPFPTHFRVSGQYRVDSNGLLPVEINPAPRRGVILSFKSAFGTNEGAPGELDTFKLTLPRAAEALSNTLKPTVELTYDRLSLAGHKAARVAAAIEEANLGYSAVVDWGEGALRVTPVSAPPWAAGEASRIAELFKTKFDFAKAHGAPNIASRTATEDVGFAADLSELEALRLALVPELRNRGFVLEKFDPFHGAFPSVMVTASVRAG